jgi:hypothetical protein
MEFNFSQHNGTGKMSIGFNFEDIDHEVIKLKELGVEIVAGPKTYSWGAFNGEKNESPKRRNRHRS